MDVSIRSVSWNTRIELCRTINSRTQLGDPRGGSGRSCIVCFAFWRSLFLGRCSSRISFHSLFLANDLCEEWENLSNQGHDSRVVSRVIVLTVRNQLYGIAQLRSNENPCFYFNATSLSHYHRRDIAIPFDDWNNEYTFVLFFAWLYLFHRTFPFRIIYIFSSERNNDDNSILYLFKIFSERHDICIYNIYNKHLVYIKFVNLQHEFANFDLIEYIFIEAK